MTRYAILQADSSYRIVDATTGETISVGDKSMPAPWLMLSSDADRAALGILTVIETASPDPGDWSTAIAGVKAQIEGITA